MFALQVFLFLSFGYFFGQWNWRVYYENESKRLKTLLFPISATRCEKGPALITLFENRKAYGAAMAFLWPIKIIVLCCEWLAIALANAL